MTDIKKNQAKANLTEVIDVLLDDLSAMAAAPKTDAKQFFDKVVVSIESLFSPKYVAILARGPSKGIMLVHGSKSLAGVPIPEMSPESDFAKCLDGDNKKQLAVFNSRFGKSIVACIPVEDSIWGGLVARFEESSKVQPLTPIFEAIQEITSQFVNNQVQSRNSEFLQNFLRFSFNSHSSLDPKLVANHLANDARLILGCERLSVLRVFRHRSKLLAVSSVSSIENRSMLAKKMTRLINSACRFQKPFFSDQPPSEKSLQASIASFQAVSGFPFFAGIPLIKHSTRPASKPMIIGYVLAESDNSINRFEFSRGLQVTAPHMGLALSNSQSVSRIPFRRTLFAIGKARDFSSLPGLLAMAALFIVGIWCLLFLESDFRVRINGELRPQLERTVFAPAEGFVERVLVDHGDLVTKDQTLIELSSPDLELELEQIGGEQLRLVTLLETKKIAMNQAATGNLGDQATLGKLATEISEVEQQIGAFDDKKKFLKERIDDLAIVSPIDGRVTNWQLKRNILKKPVRWGDSLANIAFENGEWVLNFKVPEYRIGYLLEARESQDKPLEVEFFFESNPTQKMKTRVLKVADSTELDAEFGPVVIVVCEVPDEEFSKRHGARVIADVTCGKRSLLATWTQELVDSIKRKFVW